MLQQIAIAVGDKSQIGEARRAAAITADRAKLNETSAGRVAIIVTELATNLVRYAKKGLILLRAETRVGQEPGVEILAIDSGPGFDTARGLVDGYSTGGTPGNGLGAIQRLASSFDLYSSQPAGTVIMVRVNDGAQKEHSAEFQWGCVSRPAPRETECGDTWRISSRPGAWAFMISDGLGHGPDAAAASDAAGKVFDDDPFADVATFIELSHRRMTGTRGAAVAIANLDRSRGSLKYTGVGNIAGTLFSADRRQGLPSHNGIVGAHLPRLKVFEYDLPGNRLLIMHSDGLQTRWSLDSYPGLARRHPAVIAGVLFRDFYRDRDDVTVLVGAWQEGALS